MENGRRAENHTAVDDTQLHEEEDKGNPDKNQGALAEGLHGLLKIAALQNPMHGVEDHRNREIQTRKKNGDAPVIRIGIGESPCMIVQAIADDQGKLQSKHVPQDKIQVLGPALTAAFIHGEPPFSQICRIRS